MTIEKQNAWAKETEELIRALAQIPSPTGKEQKKAAYIRNWLEEQGASRVETDEAGNVYWLWGEKAERLTVFMAHMDTVFSENTDLTVRERDERLYCPGIGDNTANLACMLMAAKVAVQSGKMPKQPVLFAATTGEEGLGNLVGSRKLFETFGSVTEQAVCFDLYREAVTCQAVGSVRYEVQVRTKGGHSYNDFGNANAIAKAAELIFRLYQSRVPEKANTTFNVGTIRGGTTINSIASEAVFTYEYRSLDQECMDEMEENFRKVLAAVSSKKEAAVFVKEIGRRPCNGKVPPEHLEELTRRHQEILQRHTEQEVRRIPYSTDANIPLSMGIPSVNIGTISGGDLHTTGEYIEKDSIQTGLCIALESLMLYGEIE